MKPWQKGYPLDELRAVAAVFKSWDRGFALGAFSNVKENTVADNAAAGQLVVAAVDDELVAAMITASDRARTIKDFAGRVVGKVEQGDHVVRRMAAHPGYDGVLVEWLRQRARSGRVWVEAWQESARARSVLALLDAEHRGTKVGAASDLVGVWAIGWTGLPIDPAEAAGIASLDLEFDPTEALAQIDALEPTWASHYAVYNKRDSWSALALRGYGGLPDFIAKPAEMSKRWKADHPAECSWEVSDTPLAAALPAVGALAQLVPGAKQRVRLMRLGGNRGELSRHADITDKEAGIADGRVARVHLPLRSSPGVRFASWGLDGSRREGHMTVGRAWYLDTRKPHAAVNNGSGERIHLVVDTYSSGALRELLGPELPVSVLAPQPGDVQEVTGWEPYSLTT